MTRLKAALLSGSLALALLAAPAAATGILPLSGSQQFDNATGALLVGGKVYVYQPTTTTCAAVYTDFNLSTLHPCPIELAAGARVPPIYGADGSVRVRVLNSADVLQADVDNLALVTAASTGSSTPIPDATQIYATGDVKLVFDDQPQPGFVRLNGRTIGSATSGASERANADTEALFKKLWPFANISVVAGKGATAAADWSANKQLTLPDLKGRLIGAVDDMGGGAANRITGITGSTVVGASGGNQANTVGQVNLPNVNFTVSGITLNDPGHFHTTTPTDGIGDGGGPPNNGLRVSGGAGQALNSNTKTTGITVATQGQAASGGSGTAMTILPPAFLFTAYMRL